MAKPRVLIVDDNPVNVELLKAQLKPYPYAIETAFDGEEALKKIHDTMPDLVLLDLMMPKVSGYEVCRAIKQNKETQFIPVIVITALSELDDKLKAIELGADDFLVKPFNKLELTTRIKSLLNLKALHDDVDRSENILFSLVKALEAKDVYTRGHSERVALMGVQLARHLGVEEKEIEVLRKGALLHDIGKIGVKEEVLLKPGRLTEEEMKHIQIHPSVGFDICKPLKSLAPCLCCVRSHHERIDGEGYPDHLTDKDIPLIAKIIAVVDGYDAMVTDRPYRKKMPKEDAIKIFEKEKKSGQWDLTLVEAFLMMIRSKNEKK
ncbi:MAG: response regulator [Deltaproteobacteria bacterium]|nr:response regulator [Deltaproteobacteria bacterium]